MSASYGRRLAAPLLVLSALLATAPAPAARQEPPDFNEWLKNLIDEAGGRGYSRDLLDETLANLEPLPRVIDRDRSQAELVVTFDKYNASHVSRQMVTRGRQLRQQHRRLLARIEREYKVQPRFVLAVWGMETRYGRIMGGTPIFQALATLAWEPRRSDFFRGELFDALTIASKKYIEPSRMKGSWAGAMGHPQFMPSSYLRHAVDFDRDGRRDIWSSTADALGSIANYLKAYGWNGAQTWGREVRVSAEVLARIQEAIPRRTAGNCYAMRDMTERVPLDRWRDLGVRRADGKPLPRANLDAALVAVDGGARHFLVYGNYDTILGYNCAKHYALTVALLADRLN